MRKPSGSIALLLASAIVLFAACEITEVDPLEGEGAAEVCDEFSDESACTEAVESCDSTSEPEECEDAVSECGQTDDPTECVDSINLCTQETDVEQCVEQVFDCRAEDPPATCPDSESSPLPMTLLEDIDLSVGQHRRGDATYMPGRCSGSTFMSPIRMSHLPPLTMIQGQGTVEQRTEGRELSDGMTIVLVDTTNQYDEFYVFIRGDGTDQLQGLSLYGDEGSLPDFKDIPMLERHQGWSGPLVQKAIEGTIRHRDRLLDVIDAGENVCDLGAVVDFR